ncbi:MULTISPECIES: glycosyltransferase [unclassified Cyanobium]|uniref:glycosyltransferase n=1 Tax=unclassified Cyanobium TaxID=2627006 RepID=UPI0020CB7831|nr:MULTISPECIES: glycosyltransferase family 2 protein [unclassified Cyanobium]MCP9860316.1 glycosyltransferase family 2 protein [Cyanobium sp. Cruz-8H5]MCP9867583.1 glycosyltransferase family 2 protein [Cyanobium sp. Cruz-8D1]
MPKPYQASGGRRLFFITVNYFCSNLIGELIASTTSYGEADCEFIVVNNSPGDTAIDAVANQHGVTLLQASHNLGFGSGCNLALDHVHQRDPQALAWLINPDAHLLPEAISYVRSCISNDPSIAILGTRIMDMDGRLWFSQGSFNPWLGTLKHRFDDVVASPRPITTHPTRWLSGCSMVFNLAAFDSCPRFDPQYFLDYEDADICLRYERLGHRVRVTQAVLVEHQVSAITQRVPGAKFRHATFSKLYLLHRHATPLALGLNLLYFALRPVTFLAKDPDRAKGRWAGLLDYLRWVGRRLRGDRSPRHPRTRFTIAS